MSQHDYMIADQSGASFLDDLNDMAAAISSTNAGAAEPATKYAYMPWADTTTGIFKVRNAANTAWISIFNLATGALIGTAANALALSGIGSSIDSAVQGGSLSSIIGQHTNNNLLRFSLAALATFGCITTDNIASQSVASATNATNATSATDIANFRAFHAYKSTYQQSGSTVIFDTVLAQKGTAYNATTGVFTAPVAGWYQFSASPQITGDAAWHANIGFYLSIDGVICAGYYITMPTSAMYEGYCISATVYLTAGQQVEVKPNWTLSTSLYVSGGRASSFSGHYLGAGA